MKTKTLGTALGAAAVLLAAYGVYDGMFRTPETYPAVGRADAGAAENFYDNAPMTADEEMQTLLPTLIGEDPNVRGAGLEAAAGLLDRGGEALSEDMREETARAVAAVYDREGGEDEKSASIKDKALRLLLTRLDGPSAERFAADVLGSRDPAAKTRALRVLSENWIKSETVRNAAYAAARSDGVPDWVKPAVLRRALGAKAEGELMAMLESAEDERTLRHLAVEIQNLHKRELLGPVLAKLEAYGMLSDAKSLPWFSGKLLSSHIEGADDDELLRALQVVWLNPRLTRATMASVESRLAHADPAVRRLVARIIPDAVEVESLASEAGEEMLASRLSVETDPAVKGELEGSLTEVRKNRRATRRTEEAEEARE